VLLLLLMMMMIMLGLMVSIATAMTDILLSCYPPTPFKDDSLVGLAANCNASSDLQISIPGRESKSRSNAILAKGTRVSVPNLDLNALYALAIRKCVTDEQTMAILAGIHHVFKNVKGTDVNFRCTFSKKHCLTLTAYTALCITQLQLFFDIFRQNFLTLLANKVGCKH